MSGPQYKIKILNEMQNLIDAIDKNIAQMDLENNVARDRMDAIASNMKSRINRSIDTVNRNAFKM